MTRAAAKPRTARRLPANALALLTVLLLLVAQWRRDPAMFVWLRHEATAALIFVFAVLAATAVLGLVFGALLGLWNTRRRDDQGP